MHLNSLMLYNTNARPMIVNWPLRTPQTRIVYSDSFKPWSTSLKYALFETNENVKQKKMYAEKIHLDKQRFIFAG